MFNLIIGLLGFNCITQEDWCLTVLHRRTGVKLYYIGGLVLYYIGGLVFNCITQEDWCLIVLHRRTGV